MIFLTGDFRYFWPENIGNFATIPSAWDSILNTGIGQSQLGSLWITSYLNLTAFLTRLGIPWEFVSLFFWVLPSLLFSFLSSFLLFRFFSKNVKFAFISGIIYSLNTYFLMVLTGGQLGVALSYSLAPLVFLTFAKVIRNPTLRNSLFSGLTLGLQLLFDPRIVYITLFAVFAYLIFNFSHFVKINKNYLVNFITPFVIAVALHSYWILPLILTKSSPIPLGFGSLQGFEFLSFADFSHAFSLLHPNWPENIFGKTYFLKPEFLILPILAFSSLLFIKKGNKERTNFVIFFSLLALLGAFLAKGANPPFGEINVWLFQNFPGMAAFRDPTKWYLLIALSYSILIPYSLSSLASWINSKFKIQNMLLLFAVFYLLFLMRPLWMKELKQKTVPVEYVQLKDFLNNQKRFSRTLWIPQWQRYGFFSNTHPAIGRFELLKQASSSGQIGELKKEGAQKLLQDFAVRYLVVPYDSENEIFLKDRKYDEKLYLKTIKDVRQIPNLKQINGFGRIAVFENPNYKDHFWSFSKALEIDYKFVNSTKYVVNLRNVKSGDVLVFSEGFDGNWRASNKSLKVWSRNFENLNGFVLNKDGNYSLEIYYAPQEWVNIGLFISIATLISAFSFLVFGSKLKKMIK